MKVFTLIALLVTNIICSQTKTITGTVTDEVGPLAGAIVIITGTQKGTETDFDGRYSIQANIGDILEFSFIGMKTKKITIGEKNIVNVLLEDEAGALQEVIVTARTSRLKRLASSVSSIFTRSSKNKSSAKRKVTPQKRPKENTEHYAMIRENGFKDVSKNPLSTFSVDVDKASYSNVRRYINNGSLPPTDAVRIEEMINYFDYDYSEPKNEVPFSINTELASCPWNQENLLLHIGLQGKKIALDKLPPSNIVFLLDVSGSMDAENKLPLLKSSLKLLLGQLRPKDRVAIVVYAGSSGLILPSTSCEEKKKIINALDRLEAGGSTAGGEGLKLAYKVATENFMKNGNNRIILATDGDFNVGIREPKALERYIVKKRKKGIAISVLGFGMGNYKDDTMETIANKGNGNYAYIDNLLEARKVLVSEFGGTLHTIAKDVKFQLEFNPAKVSSYRLIGYENRLLNEEDFNDDKKDAGEIGSGHTVTALYEIVTANGKKLTTGLKYQDSKLSDEAINSNDLITLKLRYKKPKQDKSKLIKQAVKSNPIAIEKTSNNFRFSAAVAEFGMLLRNSEYLKKTSWKSAYDLAKGAKGKDLEGYRGEMLRLIKSTELLKDSNKK